MALSGQPLVEPEGGRALRVPYLPLVAAGLLLALLLAPWPLAHKAHAVLHGLCAQRPSHSLELGGQPLPFDARMTGIYGGFLVAFAWLVARGRLRAFRLPGPAASAVLLAFVAALGVDGLNALLVDLRLAPLYPPDNRLRLATGLLTGITLAVGLCFLLATTLWRAGDWSSRTVTGVREVGLLILLQAPFAAIALSGIGLLHAPVSLFLVVAATVAVSAIVLATGLLISGRDRTFRSRDDVGAPAALALLGGVAVMLAIAGGRFWLERAYGIRTLP